MTQGPLRPVGSSRSYFTKLKTGSLFFFVREGNTDSVLDPLNIYYRLKSPSVISYFLLCGLRIGLTPSRGSPEFDGKTTMSRPTPRGLPSLLSPTPTRDEGTYVPEFRPLKDSDRVYEWEPRRRRDSRPETLLRSIRPLISGLRKVTVRTRPRRESTSTTVLVSTHVT